PATMWRWATPAGQAVLASRDLARILRHHRTVNALSQTALGEVLGYDKTFISAVENHRRVIPDVESRRRVAARLGIPPHVLGVTDAADTDFAAMLQFGDSTLRLAEIARQSGQATTAVNELWPLVARLEARVADGHTERDVLALLGRARTSLGVALGHILPEERMATAAHWTGKGLAVTRRLDDRPALVHALRMHGNELRKTGLHWAALDRLTHAANLATTDAERAAVQPLLARAAGAAGRSGLFDHTCAINRRLLDRAEHDALFNPLAHHEIHLRGLMTTGRITQAAGLAANAPDPTWHVTPQWRVIEHVTTGRVLLAAGDTTGARDRLLAAVTLATTLRLPHQLQRIIRASTGQAHVRDQALTSLAELRSAMAA
ncbi:helix-turn-helix domain-containing protein, partial [Streptomyces microflavus]